MSRKSLAEFLKEAAEEGEKYEKCMSLSVSEQGDSVELVLDTGSGQYYGDWIEGEGGDICLLRDCETNKVIGCHLPLYNKKLAVFYEGPIRINAGFRKSDKSV